MHRSIYCITWQSNIIISYQARLEVFANVQKNLVQTRHILMTPGLGHDTVHCQYQDLLAVVALFLEHSVLRGLIILIQNENQSQILAQVTFFSAA